MDMIPQKRCVVCNQVFPATTEFFHPHHTTFDRLRSQCKTCRSLLAKQERQKKHPPDILPPEHKRCTKCKQVFPATTEFFPPAKRYAYGVAAWCRTCDNRYQLKYRQSKREPVYIPPSGFKRCTACLQEFPATTEYFSVRRDKKDGLSGRCKPCVNHTQYANRQRYILDEAFRERIRIYNRLAYNPEQKRQYAATHHEQKLANNRNRKARQKQAPGKHTAQDIQRQLKAQHTTCYYCKQKLNKYHVDHIIPLSRGGSNGPENLVLTCPTCNLRKHNKLPYEWIEGGRLL